MTSVVGLITARGGSKSIPGKNIRPLAGKPLLSWTVEAALNSHSIERVVLSTDDEAIADVGRSAGAEVPFTRPAELSQDDSSHISVVLHAIDWLQECSTTPDYILLLQPTSPFRTSEDIDAAVDLATSRNAVAVVGVVEAERHPYLAKRILDDGSIADFVSFDIDYPRRQNLPPVYTINGAIYLNKTVSLVRDRVFTPPGTLPYFMPQERSLDIDTPWNFHLAQLIAREQLSHSLC